MNAERAKVSPICAPETQPPNAVRAEVLVVRDDWCPGGVVDVSDVKSAECPTCRRRVLYDRETGRLQRHLGIPSEERVWIAAARERRAVLVEMEGIGSVPATLEAWNWRKTGVNRCPAKVRFRSGSTAWIRPARIRLVGISEESSRTG